VNQKASILLVDDSRFYLTIEGQFLKSTGAHIVEAQTLEAASIACRERKPDLIYLDAHLEGGQGIGLCRQLKTTPQLNTVPVIHLFDQEDPAQLDRCLDAGCDGYLTKPLSRQRFLELGRSLLAGIREKRSPCELRVDYRIGAEPRSGNALDISSGGVFLQASERLVVGDSLKLEIHLRSGNEVGPRIFCDGSIAWENRPNEPVKPHLPEGYGVKFTVVPPQTAAILNGFLKTLNGS